MTTISTTGTIMVDFWANWCGPCLMLSPILDEIATENKVTLVKIDVEAEPDLAQQYNVSSLPTVIIIRDGQILSTLVGSRPRSEYEKYL